MLTVIRVDAGTADESATATVRQLLASIGKLRTTTDAAQKKMPIGSIDNSLAIEKLSKQALGAQWSKLDAPERAHFVALVKELLEKIAYPNAAQFFADFSIKIVGEDASGDQRTVQTTVTRPEGGAVSINYILERMNHRWTIVDVILDRQSLAASMTTQIQATLKSSSYQDLVKQLESRLTQATPPH
ncbi:MAG: ABC transporter substrate-binding protein [Candidatus Binataceae bacterium]